MRPLLQTRGPRCWYRREFSRGVPSPHSSPILPLLLVGFVLALPVAGYGSPIAEPESDTHAAARMRERCIEALRIEGGDDQDVVDDLQFLVPSADELAATGVLDPSACDWPFFDIVTPDGALTSAEARRARGLVTLRVQLMYRWQRTTRAGHDPERRVARVIERDRWALWAGLTWHLPTAGDRR